MSKIEDKIGVSFVYILIFLVAWLGGVACRGLYTPEEIPVWKTRESGSQLIIERDSTKVLIRFVNDKYRVDFIGTDCYSSFTDFDLLDIIPEYCY